MVKKTQNPKKDEPKAQTPPGTGPEGPDKPTPPATALTAEERTELEELRKKKKQFAESSAEGIRLTKRVGELEEKLVEASATPSGEELKKRYPDFEDMDPEEKAKAVETLKNEKRLKVLEAKEKMRSDYDALPQDIKEKIEKKEGGFNSFRDYACSPDNAGQKDLLNIAKAYLWDEKPEEPETPETPEAPGLEPGAGGPPTQEPPAEGYTEDELKEMRTNQPELYRRLAREGKLKVRK